MTNPEFFVLHSVVERLLPQRLTSKKSSTLSRLRVPTLQREDFDQARLAVEGTVRSHFSAPNVVDNTSANTFRIHIIEPPKK